MKRVILLLLLVFTIGSISVEANNKQQAIDVYKDLYEGVPTTSGTYLTRIGCVNNIMHVKYVNKLGIIDAVELSDIRHETEDMITVDSIADYARLTDGISPFKDVMSNTYYHDYNMYETGEMVARLQNAKKYGIATGYSDGTFRPNEKIKKEDMYVMMYRLMISDMKINIPIVSDVDLSVLDNYVDGNEVSGYAKEAISVMLTMELYDVNGNDNMLDPKGYILVDDAKRIFEKFYPIYVID